MKRNAGLDYTRIILTFIIVLFHFADAFNLHNYKLFTMVNGTWGWGAVGAFTVLSGYLLRTRYREIGQVKTFYKKRLLTLYPSLYVAFIICFIIHSIELGSPFYGGHPVKIIYSVLGIDSYIGLYGISTYSVVGEWFTGLIIMLYILYPALNFVMNKIKIIGTIIVIALFSANVLLGLDPTIVDASIFTGIFLFWSGMLIADHSAAITRLWWMGIIGLAAVLALIVVPINIPRAFINNVLSVVLFMTLLILFRAAGTKSDSKFNGLNKSVTALSSVAYEVYLIHHFIIYKLMNILPDMHNNPYMYILYFAGTMLLVLMAAYIVHIIAVQAKRIIDAKCNVTVGANKK